MSGSIYQNSTHHGSCGTSLHRQPTFIGEKRQDNDILQDKLPALMRQATFQSSPYSGRSGQIDSEAMREVLWSRLQLKNLIIAAVAEFLGTFFFLFGGMAIGTRAGDDTGAPKLDIQLFASLGFGFSLTISAWVFYRISGGVQNPAITLALTLTGAMNWTKCIVLSIVQCVAAITAAAMVSALLPGKVNAQLTLNPQVSVFQGFLLEFLMTCMLIFAVLMLAMEKHRATFLAPVGIGLTLFVTQLLGQSYTGAGVNPARALGTDAVMGKFYGYSWIYYVAPYCSAIVTAGFYWTLKWARYETTSPDQDADEQRAGQLRQVIIDTTGNVVGSVETVKASEYNGID